MRFWLGFLLVGASVFLPAMAAIFLVVFIGGYSDPTFWAIVFPSGAVIVFSFAAWRWKRNAGKHPLAEDTPVNSYEAGMHAARVGFGLIKKYSRRY